MSTLSLFFFFFFFFFSLSLSSLSSLSLFFPPLLPLLFSPSLCSTYSNRSINRNGHISPQSCYVCRLGLVRSFAWRRLDKVHSLHHKYPQRPSQCQKRQVYSGHEWLLPDKEGGSTRPNKTLLLIVDFNGNQCIHVVFITIIGKSILGMI